MSVVLSTVQSHAEDVNWMLRFCKEMLQYFQYCICSKDWLQRHKLPQDKITTIMLMRCLKQFFLLRFFLKFSIRGRIFEFVYYDTCFFSFRWIRWWDCRQSNKLSRIEICSFASVSHIDSHSFHEWWRSLLDYEKNYF